MDCTLPGSNIHGILQARVLEWGAIAFSVKPAQNIFIILFLLMKQQAFILFYWMKHFILFLNFYFYFILFYNTVLVLPYIDMNPPQVYMSS